MYVSFIELTKAYESVGRTLLWRVLIRFCVPQNIISVIRQSHDSMRACVQLDDEMRSGGFVMNSVFIKGAYLQHLRGGYKHGLQTFQGGQIHHEHFGASEEQTVGGGGNQRRTSPGDGLR